MSHHRYVIVGGGAAGAAAIEGIRSRDREGGILLLSRDNFAPYLRPPLSKELWTGRMGKGDLDLYDAAFYRDHGVELQLRHEVVELDPGSHRLWTGRGSEHRYDKLLLATGGRPRRLEAADPDLEGLQYFRDLDDYLHLERRLERVEHVLVVGAGFVGLELAAALRGTGREVTLLCRREYPLHRVLPRELGLRVGEHFREHGVETVSEDPITEIEEAQGLLHAITASGGVITTQHIVVARGIEPQTDLAEAAGLHVDDGIVVDEFARTTDLDIHAAGDVARYPCVPLERSVRVEHWEHALAQGRAAGANMAGAVQPYEGIPCFGSGFFDLSFEAVGELDPEFDTHPVWDEPLRRGVVFYLHRDRVRGVLLWGVDGSAEWARGLVRGGTVLAEAEKTAGPILGK